MCVALREGGLARWERWDEGRGVGVYLGAADAGGDGCAGICGGLSGGEEGEG